jgi:surface polysaccharide O-acyltransferase-like enzyme
VESVSRHALGIYIIHPAILMAVGPLLQVAPGPLSLEQRLPGSLLPFGVLLLACLGGGWAATRLIATWRPASWAVGE